MKKNFAYITGSLRRLVYFLLPLLISWIILEQIRDFNVKQILLAFTFLIIYSKVKGVILGLKSSKYSGVSNFNDAVANELMRMQSKLDRLVNYVYPCFETPKEMKRDPMKNFHFRKFVAYFEAYSSYPGIATCTLFGEQENTYILCLEKSGEVKKNQIHLSCTEGKIAYSMIASFDTPVHNVLTDIQAPKKFTLSSLNKVKRQIIWFAMEQGHLDFPAIIILKKTNGLRYYDPLKFDFLTCAPENISEQDLVNLNSAGPYSYKNITIKNGSIIKAYIYDRESFGLLTPDESEIKIISIDKEYGDEFGRYKTFTIEIQPVYGEYSAGFTGKKLGNPIVKTISHFEC